MTELKELSKTELGQTNGGGVVSSVIAVALILSTVVLMTWDIILRRKCLYGRECKPTFLLKDKEDESIK